MLPVPLLTFAPLAGGSPPPPSTWRLLLASGDKLLQGDATSFLILAGH